MTPSNNTPSPIATLITSLFKPLNIEISDLQSEPESKEDFAHTFQLEIKKAIF